ncbi:MAG: glycosyltransferase [Hydrogenophaga sp.]|nr:glycosyltransferase [Hydrogenophaga sp.]
MNLAPAPTFSVIVATYNWSAALRLALASVLEQTEHDFELLVIGDHCSDDSEAVVRSFGDSRLVWVNLERNCGSQWGPNNTGLSMARGRYIAYLGHDDLWAPGHLRAARETFERTGADVVAAACLLYGPPSSGLRAVTGFFPNDRFTPRHFFPPSSLLHTRQIARDVGGWVGPDEARVAVDYEFIVRCHEAGAAFAMTGQLSVFKFNAAWRRNAYRRRDVGEQSACLSALREDSQAHLQRELTTALRAASEDRLLRIETPMSTSDKASAGAVLNQTFKGSHHGGDPSDCLHVNQPIRFPCENESAGFEWHSIEQDGNGSAFRWSGPACRSARLLPVHVDRPLMLTLQVVNEIQAGLLAESHLSVNGRAVEARHRPAAGGGFLWTAHIAPDELPSGERAPLLLTLSVPATHRPIDLDINSDRRWLGLAIGWIEIEPT